MTNRTRWIGLVIFIAICLGAAALGAIATTPEIEGWYRTIEKPSWNPPDWIFGPVWTTLYILMAIAAWLVWRPAGFAAAAMPLTLFAVQLVLNIAWSWIFFGLHQPGWAFAEILVLWLSIAATTAAFFRSSPVAGSMEQPTATIQFTRINCLGVSPHICGLRVIGRNFLQTSSVGRT